MRFYDYNQFNSLPVERFAEDAVRDATFDLVFGLADSGEVDDARIVAEKLKLVCEHFSNNGDEGKFVTYITLLGISVMSMSQVLGAGYIARILREFGPFLAGYREFDLIERIRAHLRPYESDPVDELSIAVLLSESLENCSVEIGANPARSFKEILQKYNSSVEWRKERTSFDRANFISQSPETRALDPDEKSIVGRMLEVYDWLMARRKTLQSLAPARGVQSGDIRRMDSPSLAAAARLDGATQFSPPTRFTPPRAPLRPPVKTAPSAPAAPRSASASAPAIDPKAVEQLKALTREANFETPISLSHALANADQGQITQQGNLRAGKPAQAEPYSAVKSNIPDQPTPVPAPKPPLVQASKPTVPAPARAETSSADVRGGNVARQLTEVLKTYSPAVSSPSSGPLNQETARGNSGEVVDLSRRPPVEISAIKSPEELARLTIADVRGQHLQQRLDEIRQKIGSLAQSSGVPAKQLVNTFYRSPLYTLYVAMAVAVMNDPSSDQNQAFEKLTRT